MSELWFEIRARGAAHFAKIALLTLVFLGLYNILSFTQGIDQAIDRSFSQQSSYNLYSLCDTLTDPDAFSAFRQSESNMTTVCDFYNRLNADKTLAFVSAFNQPLPISNFKGDASFRYAYGTGMNDPGQYVDPSSLIVEDIKSLQLNEHAFHFYNLSVDKGSEPAWDSLDYSKQTIPVLLGSNYDGIYHLGDAITGLYYFRETTFEVIGFLRDDASIYYKGEPNYYLISSIVVPYPAALSVATGNDFGFMGRLAFAMVNGDVAAPKDMSTQDVLGVLNALSAESGFSDYSLLNAPEYLVRMSWMRSLITDNLVLVVAAQTAITVALTAAILFLDRSLSAYRGEKAHILRLAGHDRASIIRILRPSIASSCIVAYALSLGIAGLLPNQSFAATMEASAIFAGICILDLLVQRRLTAHCPSDRISSTL